MHTRCLVFLAIQMAAVLAWAQPQPAARKARAVPEGVKLIADLEYVPGGHERQKLDLYLPEKATGPLPVVLWVHGGGWRAGDKAGSPAVFLATKGLPSPR